RSDCPRDVVAVAAHVDAQYLSGPLHVSDRRIALQAVERRRIGLERRFDDLDVRLELLDLPGQAERAPMQDCDAVGGALNLADLVRGENDRRPARGLADDEVE